MLVTRTRRLAAAALLTALSVPVVARAAVLPHAACGEERPPATSAASARPQGGSAAADRRAVSAPSEVAASVAGLAAYLVQGARDDREKARAIFAWITSHLAYDLDGVYSGKWEQEPEAVLRVLRTDCLGHSRLFAALALAAGLEAEVVGGQLRGVERDPKLDPKYVTVAANGIEYVSHSWNAVKLDGEWRLLDVTAANGRSRRGGATAASHPTNDYYFLPPAGELAYTHFPQDPKWQLLPDQYSRDAHSRLPLLNPESLALGVRPRSHPNSVCAAEGSLSVTVTAPPGAALVAELRQDGRRLEGRYAFVQRGLDGWEVNAAFPRPGSYGLRISARVPGRAASYRYALDYRVEASEGSAGPDAFPETWDIFRDARAYLSLPASGTLAAGTPQPFRIVVPGALMVGVRAAGQTVPLEGRGGEFAGVLGVPPGEVLLVARFPARPGFEYALVRYFAR